MGLTIDLSGLKAIVCASSRGLGFACADALSQTGASVVLNGRNAASLEQARSRLFSGEIGVEITTVAGDISDPETQSALLEACPEPDILVTNNGGPPLRDFRELRRPDMIDGLTANMLAPIEMIQRVIDGMTARRFGRIVNITSVTVKSPIDGLDLSSGARAGLTSFLAGVARDVAAANVTINQLLPGFFDTDRVRTGLETRAEKTGRPAKELVSERNAGIPAARIGDPAEFGLACAFLCARQSGYITGQNLLLDGGMFRSAF